MFEGEDAVVMQAFEISPRHCWALGIVGHQRGGTWYDLRMFEHVLEYNWRHILPFVELDLKHIYIVAGSGFAKASSTIIKRVSSMISTG